WRAPEKWIGGVEASLRSGGASVVRGGSYDSWDLEVRGGALGSVRIRALIEEHGRGRQLVRLRSYPRCRGLGLLAPALTVLLAIAPALDRNWELFGVLIGVTI